MRPTVEVDRHDNDNLEIKLGFHSPLDYDVDVFFFAPPTLGLNLNNPKLEFLQSLKSFVRLQTSMGLAERAERVSAELVTLEAQRLYDVLQKDNLLATNIISAVKSVAVAYEGYLKSRSKFHTRGDSHRVSVLGNEARQIELLAQELITTEKLVSALRQSIRFGLTEQTEQPLPTGGRPPLIRLNEYMSYLMVDYLARFTRHVESLKDQTGAQALHNHLHRIGMGEFELRKQLGLNINLGASDDERAEYLYKLSLLKKYFQRLLFINVKSTPVAKRVFQPIAASAAALAAVWAGVFQQAQISNDSFIYRMGLTPVTVLTLGVLVYVVKDRMKDVLRNFLAGRVEKVLPDWERTLVYDRPGSKPQELGRITETVLSVQAKNLPQDIYDARYAGENSRLEAELGEDIIHYSKRIMLKQNLADPGQHWGLREIMRVNLGRFFHNLDDPFREMSYLEESGHVSRSETHRVYHAYIVVRVTYRDGRDENSELKVASMTMDKQGLVSINSDGYDDGYFVEDDLDETALTEVQMDIQVNE